MPAEAKRNGSVVALRKKPGPKPGTHHAGTFKPGYDPRRWTHGPVRSEVKRTVEELFREGAEDARDFLLQLVNDPKASKRDRYAAATEILNRSYGKPVDRRCRP